MDYQLEGQGRRKRKKAEGRKKKEEKRKCHLNTGEWFDGS